MRATPRLNRVINRTDGRTGGLQLRRSGVDHEPGGGQHGLLCGQWYGCFAGRHPARERRSTPGVLRMKELVAGRGPHLLERLDRRPAAQHIADEEGADVSKPV
jgi:hypothetical protein